MTMVLVLVRWLRCSLLSFSFRAFLLIWFVSLLVGALCVEVGFGDLEAFLQCPFFLVKSVLLTLRHDLVLFYWVPSLMRSILMTLRYNLFFSVHSLRWSRSLDPEARPC